MEFRILTVILEAALVFQGVNCSASSGITTSDSTTNTSTSTQPSINDSANQSSSGNSFAQAVNYVTGGAEVVMGGTMIKTGSAHDNWGEVAAGVLMVGMGLSNIAQGNEHGSSADTSGVTSAATNGYGTTLSADGSTTSTTSTDAYTAAALSDGNFQAVASTLKDLAAAGVYNPKTGALTVNGQTYSASDLSSTGSMAAAGFSQGAIDGALAANAEAEKKAIAKLEKVKSTENGYEEGGGANSSKNAGKNSTNDNGTNGVVSEKSRAQRKTASDLTASVAGLSKNFNGEAIGVAADNIFFDDPTTLQTQRKSGYFYRRPEYSFPKVI